jgi:hypothetical protein
MFTQSLEKSIVQMSSASLERQLSDHPKGYPLEDSRVGALVRCGVLFSKLIKLCNKQIQRLREQEGQSLESLFFNLGTLTSVTSPWYRFGAQDIQNQKKYLTKELLPWIYKYWKTFYEMRGIFALEWRIDQSRRVSEDMKAVLDKVLHAGRGLEDCFNVPALDGPFYKSLEVKCRA